MLKDLDDLDSLLIVDIGGTTLDIAHVRSKMSGFTKTHCDPKTGVSIITEAAETCAGYQREHPYQFVFCRPSDPGAK
ncbi:hypothetical protein AB9K36_02375 [Klebsiella michiganensis]